MNESVDKKEEKEKHNKTGIKEGGKSVSDKSKIMNGGLKRLRRNF